MSIFIRGKRVQSIRISSTLLEAKKYIYASKKGGVSELVLLFSFFFFSLQQTPIIFGFVPKEEDKGHFGVMMYFNNRLIKVTPNLSIFFVFDLWIFWILFLNPIDCFNRAMYM
jgi:hypothetical protein